MDKSNKFSCFKRMLEFAGTHCIDADFAIGSNYLHPAKPIASPISEILKEKPKSDIAVKAKTVSYAVGDSSKEGEPLAEYFNRTGVAEEVTKIEKDIQELLKGKTIDIKTIKGGNGMLKTYKEKQEKIKNKVSASHYFAPEGGGDIRVAVVYSPNIIYLWKNENFGFLHATFEASLKPNSAIAKDMLNEPLIEFVGKSCLDEIELSVNGFGSIARNSRGGFNIFIEKG